MRKLVLALVVLGLCLAGTSAFAELGVLETIDVGTMPSAIAIATNEYDEEYVYVANYYSDNISVIDSDGNVTNEGVGGRPIALAVSPDEKYVYVAASTSNAISVIDTSINKRAEIINVGTEPCAMALSPNGSYLYVANKGSNNVSAIDTSQRIVVATVNVGTAPTAIAVAPYRSYVYVANYYSDNVSVIDTSTNSVVATINIEDVRRPKAIAVTPEGALVYVAYEASTKVVAIDTWNFNFFDVIETFGNESDDIAITPDGNYAYVVNRGTYNVSVIDAPRRVWLENIDLGTDPIAITITPDGNYAYVANHYSNSVSVIDTSNRTIEATIGVGYKPYAIAITPDGNYAYVVNKGDDRTLSRTVSKIGELPPNIPPVAIAGDDLYARAGEIVILDGSSSYDHDGTIVSWKWKNQSGMVLAEGEIAQYTSWGYAEQLLTLEVTDDRGGIGTDEMLIFNTMFMDLQYQINALNLQVNPTLQITSPADGATVSGIVSIDIFSNNEGNLNRCYFYIDNTYMGQDYTSPFSFNWNSQYYPNTSHAIKVKGYFRNGVYASKEATIGVTTDNETVIEPSISITSPSMGDTVSGVITVSTDATDEFSSVYLYVDGSFKGWDGSAPFEFELDTTTLSNTSHSLRVRGRHALTRQYVDDTIGVDVSN